jgi:hypothetical protein
MTFQVQTLIPMTTNVPADIVTNTLHLSGADLAAVTPGIAAIKVFYNAISAHYSSVVSQNAWRFKVYNLDDTKPRAPVYEETWNLTAAPAGATLPAECAMVLSFQAARQSGEPQARRRNRIFIGPLDQTLLGVDGRWTTAANNLLANAADALLASSVAAGGWSWVVTSAFGGPYEINNGWVDNAPDTQRRRGVKATARTIFN